MIIRDLINQLQALPDDQLEVIIKIPHALTRLGNGAIIRETKYYDIHDIEDWSNSNHYELLIDENEIEMDCEKCDGYGKIEQTIPEPGYGEPLPEPLTITIDCPNCAGRGYLDINEYFKRES